MFSDHIVLLCMDNSRNPLPADGRWETIWLRILGGLVTYCDGNLTLQEEALYSSASRDWKFNGNASALSLIRLKRIIIVKTTNNGNMRRLSEIAEIQRSLAWLEREKILEHFNVELRLSPRWVRGDIGSTHATKTCHDLNAYTSIFETNNHKVINNTSLDSL
jgi:hypothetical protein